MRSQVLQCLPKHGQKHPLGHEWSHHKSADDCSCTWVPMLLLILCRRGMDSMKRATRRGDVVVAFEAKWCLRPLCSCMRFSTITSGRNWHAEVSEERQD